MGRNAADLEAEQARARVTAGLAQARRLADEGRTREALAICERLHTSAPTHPDVLGLLGLLYLRTGDLSKALARLAAALLHAHNNPHVLYTLAQVYLQAGAPVHALHSLRSYGRERQRMPAAVNLPDADALVARLVALLHQEPGIAELAPPIQDRAMMAAERGRLRLLFAEDPEQALGDLREAIRLAPRYPPPRNNMSLAYFYNAQTDQAITVLETTLREILPANIYALASLAFVRWAAGAEAAAVAPLLGRAAAGLTAQSRLLDRMRVAEVAGVLGDHALAHAVLAPLEALLAGEPDALVAGTERAASIRLLATALANQDRRDEAAAWLRTLSILALDPLARRLLSAVESGETLSAAAGGGYPYLAWEDLLSLHVLRRLVSGAPGHRLALRPAPPPAPAQVAARLTALYPRLPLTGALLLWMGDPTLENLALTLLALVATPAADALLEAHLRGTTGSYSGRQQAGYALLDAGRLPNGAVIPFWSGTAWSEIRLYRLVPQRRDLRALQQSLQALTGRLLEARAP